MGGARDPYYRWLLTSVLWVLMALGMLLVLEGWPTPEVLQDISPTIRRCGIGFVVYMIAYFRVMDDRMLRQRFNQTMARLDDAITKLGAKLARHQPAAAT